VNPVITAFPVCNGDMTLIQLESGRSILIDINIRAPGDDIRDVVADLRARLKKDHEERHYVDVMLLTHPDQDHCRGLREHFHLGSLDDYKKPDDGSDGKIVIREMWSSPMVFRRQSSIHTLCKDAAAWNTEARRRANLFKEHGYANVGDYIQIMGEDENAEKTKGLETVLVKAGQTITKIAGFYEGHFKGFLIAPLGKGDDAEEERRTKNNSSVIVRFSIANGIALDATKYLAGGDALVGIWERVWQDHKHETHVLEYHLLGAPHHCSWHSLSWESWGDTKGNATASSDAKKALGQALDGAYIIASSKEILDEDVDPPCIGAKREYEKILAPVEGKFVTTTTHEDEDGPTPMEFEVLATGPVLQDPGSTLGIDLVTAAATNPLSAAVLKSANDRSKTVLPREQRGFA
jgi:hypothetical protein